MMPYGYSIDFLNYGAYGGGYNTNQVFYQFNGSLSGDEYGLGEIPNGSAPYGNSGQTQEGSYLDGVATNGNHGGLPQSVWDPNQGRVAPTQMIILTNVNGVAFDEGTAADLLANLTNIDTYLKHSLYQQAYVILQGGGIFNEFWANDYAN